MRHLSIDAAFAVAIVLWLMPCAALAQYENGPPETFVATGQVLGKNGGASAMIRIHIERYTDDGDRAEMEDALRTGGYEGFLPVLRQAPEVGYVELHGRKVAVRWAHQQITDTGRTISVVTDNPVFFVNGGHVNAKPRAGFELAVILLDVDLIGLGTGSMAPAARVKPGGATGVQIDDYAEKMVKLATVRKSYQ